jgi:hypothetical protein
MNNTSSSSGNTASNTNEKKIFVTDPFPVVRYLNMALAAGMLIFAIVNILSIFSLSWSGAIIISFMFSIY